MAHEMIIRMKKRYRLWAENYWKGNAEREREKTRIRLSL